MSLFNKIVLLTEILSKIGNTEMNRSHFSHDQEFRKANNLSFANRLPQFDNEKPYIIVNGKKVMVGTILKRPLELNPPIFSKVEYHYAVVLGTTISGQEILIEMTKGRNVSLVTKQGMLVNRFAESEIEIEFNAPPNITRESLIERAKKFEYSRYHILDLNCIIFSDYVVHEIEPPQRMKEIKKFQARLCDISISLRNLQISDPINKDYNDFLAARIDESKKVRETIALAIS